MAGLAFTGSVIMSCDPQDVEPQGLASAVRRVCRLRNSRDLGIPDGRSARGAPRFHRLESVVRTFDFYHLRLSLANQVTLACFEGHAHDDDRRAPRRRSNSFSIWCRIQWPGPALCCGAWDAGLVRVRPPDTLGVGVDTCVRCGLYPGLDAAQDTFDPAWRSQEADITSPPFALPRAVTTTVEFP